MLRLLVGSSLCFAVRAAHTQAVRPESTFNAFERFATAFLAEHKVPGAAIALVRRDSVVFAKGFGVASIESREPIDSETLFQIGSASKMFTAALVAELAAEGQLDLRTPSLAMSPDSRRRLARARCINCYRKARA